MARSRTHFIYRDENQRLQTLCGLKAYQARDAGEKEPSCKLCKVRKLRLARLQNDLQKM